MVSVDNVSRLLRQKVDEASRSLHSRQLCRQTSRRVRTQAGAEQEKYNIVRESRFSLSKIIKTQGRQHQCRMRRGAWFTVDVRDCVRVYVCVLSFSTQAPVSHACRRSYSSTTGVRQFRVVGCPTHCYSDTTHSAHIIYCRYLELTPSHLCPGLSHVFTGYYRPVTSHHIP